MKREEAIEKLNRQILEIDNLKKKKRYSPEFKKWHRDTEITIEKIFGDDTRHINDFNGVSFTLSVFWGNTPDSEFQKNI